MRFAEESKSAMMIRVMRRRTQIINDDKGLHTRSAKIKVDDICFEKIRDVLEQKKEWQFAAVTPLKRLF